MSAFRAFPRVSRLSVLLLVALVAVLATAPKGEGSHLPNVVAIVPVGTKPIGVAVNSTTNRIYVANETLGSVSVIDGTTNTEVDTDGNGANGITRIPVGSLPGFLAVNTAAARLYVSIFGTNSVSVIDTNTNTGVDTDGNAGNGITPIPVGTAPHGIAVHSSGRVFVANRGDNTVSVIDGATNTEIDTDGNGANGTTPISVGVAPVGIAIDSGASRVYVSNELASTVTVIDSTTYGTVATVAVGTGPTGIGLNTTTGRLYIANSGADSVSVVDTSTNAAVATIPVSDEPRGVAVDGGSNRVFVTNRFSNSVAAIDGATNTVSRSVGVGSQPFGVALNTSTGRLFVANIASNNVYVLAFPTHAAPTTAGPNLVSFQGRLTDSGGNPVADGNYSIKFRIYDAAAGGTLQWEETQTVAVAGSVFSVQLGTATPLAGGVFAGESRYLEVQVESDPALTPRQRFTTVPYSVNAQSLDGLGVGDLTNRDLVVLLVGSAQSCPTGFTFLMSVNAGVNGTDAAKACQSQSASQLFYIGSTQTCPTGWTQVDINAAVSGTSPADACYR